MNNLKLFLESEWTIKPCKNGNPYEFEMTKTFELPSNIIDNLNDWLKEKGGATREEINRKIIELCFPDNEGTE